MHRFFVPPAAIRGNKVEFPERTAHQIRNVFHMASGDRVVVLDDTGWEYHVGLQLVSHKAVIGEVALRQPSVNDPTTELTLFAAILKKDNFEWVLQKCTELGTASFVPMITERTVVTAPSEHKVERWERITTEAAEQSGRGRLPAIEPVSQYDQVIGRLKDFDAALFFWEAAGQGDLKQILNQSGPLRRIACLVGPEGGFTDGEAELAQQAGAKVVTLGPRILRAETAAVVGTSLVMHECGEMSLPEDG